MTWLFAMSAVVVPMYQRASQARYMGAVRCAGEAGLDYAVSELNKAMELGEVAPIDDPSEDGVPVSSLVPLSAIGNFGAQVVIQVNNVRPPSNSSIYDPQWDPSITGAPNAWRTVTATASYAGLSRSIRVILKPEPNLVGGTGAPTPYFQFAMFGKSYLGLTGNARTDGYDSRDGPYGMSNQDNYGGDVGSNEFVQLSGQANVGGDLRVHSLPKESPTRVVAEASSPDVRVRDQLVVNGVSKGFTATQGPSPQPGDNVLAMGQGALPRTGDWTTPLDWSQSYDPLEVPPAKSVPGDAKVVIGSIEWSGTTGWATQPQAGEVVDLGNLSAAGQETINIRPGDYKISSLSVRGQAGIVLQPNPDGSYGPVRFFVEGMSPGENVIQITGNGIVNQSSVPSNLQLWYNGHKDVLLAGNGSMYGVLYAPNAHIKVAGNGTYFGAMMGDEVEDNGNGFVHFDKALLQTTGAAAITFPKGITQLAPVGVKTRSWQEL
jgi:hypothetical protein